MRYFIIAGEASGDMHAANLVGELRNRDPNAVIAGFGGDRMEREGVHLHRHYSDIAFMGFVEVLKHLPTILKALKKCKEDIKTFQPDAIILVDYPGFNLRIAEWAHRENIARIHYYISPQVWAWKADRAYKIKANTHHLYCILPFEPAFFETYGMEAEYVGHPLLDEIRKFEPDRQIIDQYELDTGDDLLLIMPGSRRQEIETQLAVMLDAADHFPQYKKIVACAPGIAKEVYVTLIGDRKEVYLVTGHTYTLLSCAARALVTSGTATLEAGLFGVPQVVCYKGNPISYLIARKLVKLKYISLVNLILDQPAIPELIQGAMSAKNIAHHLAQYDKEEVLETTISHYERLSELLSKEGASSHVADRIVTDIARHENLSSQNR